MSAAFPRAAAILLASSCLSLAQTRTIPPIDPELLPEPARSAAAFARMPERHRETMIALVSELEKSLEDARQNGTSQEEIRQMQEAVDRLKPQTVVMPVPVT